jgi:hypothetical protein
VVIEERRWRGLSVMCCTRLSDNGVVEGELPLYERRVWLCEHGGAREEAPPTVLDNAVVA